MTRVSQSAMTACTVDRTSEVQVRTVEVRVLSCLDIRLDTAGCWLRHSRRLHRYEVTPGSFHQH